MGNGVDVGLGIKVAVGDATQLTKASRLRAESSLIFITVLHAGHALAIYFYHFQYLIQRRIQETNRSDESGADAQAETAVALSGADLVAGYPLRGSMPRALACDAPPFV